MQIIFNNSWPADISTVEEYFRILLGGLFGIATIVVAVMSFASNIINEKCLNMYVNKLLRFNVFVIFLPIYYLVFYCFAIMRYPILATNIIWIMVWISIFLIITTRCSYLVAQYVIDTSRFEDKVLEVSIKNIKKDMKKNNTGNGFVCTKIKEAEKSINDKECRIFQDKKRRKELYKKYLELFDNEKITSDEIMTVVEVLAKEFGYIEALELCEHFKISQTTVAFANSIDATSDISQIQQCVQLIHSYFVKNTLIEDNKFENYSIIINANYRNMLLCKKYRLCTLKYIKESKFTIVDAGYLAEIINQIFMVFKEDSIEKFDFDAELKLFLKDLLKAKENYVWPYNDCEKDQAIQSALLLIGGNKNDK